MPFITSLSMAAHVSTTGPCLNFKESGCITKHCYKRIGLSHVLPFRCPEDPTTPMMDRYAYTQHDTGIFGPDYLQHLQTLLADDSYYDPLLALVPAPAQVVVVPLPHCDNKQESQRIAVHIRRGDITPCRPRTRGYPRYLPNQHYLKLIDRYTSTSTSTAQTKASQVVIYSESESFESFDVFRERGYQVVLDGSIGDVWKGIIGSDVVILSRSSFSLVPAIMAKGKVCYTPFWHVPLPHWDVVDEAFLNETHTAFRQLKDTCPNNKKKNKKGT
jgi:hypothetical protein